ncbi:unnamed protein product, partial [Effrenium voratum]
ALLADELKNLKDQRRTLREAMKKNKMDRQAADRRKRRRKQTQPRLLETKAEFLRVLVLDKKMPARPADAALPVVAQLENAGASLPDEATLRQAATQLVTELDLHQCSVKECRSKIAVACGLQPDGRAYLVTLSHTEKEEGVGGQMLDQRRSRAAQGKAEQRVREVDLWPIVIRENIAPDEVCAEKLMAYAKRSGGRALVDFCFANWDKLPGIVAKSWKTEKVEDFVAVAAQSRMESLAASRNAPWRRAVGRLRTHHPLAKRA